MSDKSVVVTTPATMREIEEIIIDTDLDSKKDVVAASVRLASYVKNLKLEGYQIKLFGPNADGMQMFVPFKVR